MGIRACVECDYVSDNDLLPSDGRCNECHGTGCEQDVIDALAESFSGQSQDCKRCGGTGECPACEGRGFIDTGILDAEEGE